MLMLLLSIALFITAAFFTKLIKQPAFRRLLPGLSPYDDNVVDDGDSNYVKVARTLLIIGGLVALLTRSYLYVDADKVGHLKKIYGVSNLPPGRIIAADGEKGPQAQILGPGFHLKFMVRVLYDWEYLPVTEIKNGHYGVLVAKDGQPLRDGQFLADAWPEDQFLDYLNGEYFLENGGQKGTQLTVLRPGKYRINSYLFEVQQFQALDVPTGHVAVVRSNVQTVDNCPDPLSKQVVQLSDSSTTTAGDGAAAKASSSERQSEQQSAQANVQQEQPVAGTLSAPIVPKGCIGVWSEPYPPGRYYLNQYAYVSTIIPTRVQTWTYKGGYTARKIDLSVGDDGSIKQDEKAIVVKVPDTAVEGAINVRVEGWTIPVDMRVVVQVDPRHAPVVVASVGDLPRIEENIITPAIRDIMRTIGGSPDRKVLDFISKRNEIVELVEQAIIPEGLKAGVSIQEVRMGEPAIPPELLVATLREQLATQLNATYKQEKIAQEERIKVERERATANQQETLVKAEIARNAAEYLKDKLRLEGEGEKLKRQEIAKGQKAIANVLGPERTLELEVTKEAIAAALQNPAIVKVPEISVQGSGSSLEGAAAVFGGVSNLAKTVDGKK